MHVAKMQATTPTHREQQEGKLEDKLRRKEELHDTGKQSKTDF